MCIGGMAYTFLKVSQGMAIGSSLFDKKGAEMVPRILEKAKAKGCEIVFPCDWLCGEEFKNEQPNGTKLTRTRTPTPTLTPTPTPTLTPTLTPILTPALTPTPTLTPALTRYQAGDPG